MMSGISLYPIQIVRTQSTHFPIMHTCASVAVYMQTVVSLKMPPGCKPNPLECGRYHLQIGLTKIILASFCSYIYMGLVTNAFIPFQNDALKYFPIGNTLNY